MAHTLLNAGPWNNATVVDAGDIPLALVDHHDVTMDQLPAIFDPSYQALASVVGQKQLEVTGPAVAIYEGDPNAKFEVKAGFPVKHPLSEAVYVGDQRVEGGQFPTGKLLIWSVYGNYDDLGKRWDEFMARVAQLQMVTGTKYGEVYQTMPGPEVDPKDIRTDIFIEILQ